MGKDETKAKKGKKAQEEQNEEERHEKRRQHIHDDMKNDSMKQNYFFCRAHGPVVAGAVDRHGCSRSSRRARVAPRSRSLTISLSGSPGSRSK
jgi:hypothetical protein